MPFDAFAKRADPDQAALIRAAWSGYTLFVYGNMIRYDPSPVDLTSYIFLLYTLLTWKFSYTDKTKILMTNGSLMKVKCIAECSPWTVLQYFWHASSDNWSWKPIFTLCDRFHCIIIHSEWSLVWIFMKERVKNNWRKHKIQASR